MDLLGRLFLILCALPVLAVSMTSTAGERALSGPRQNKEVELLITNEASYGINISSLRFMSMKSTFVRFSGVRTSLHNTNLLGNEFQDLTIKLESSNGLYARLDLPEKTNNRILEYLKKGYPEPCDCNCFAHFINQVDFKFGRFNSSSWDVNPLETEGVLTPGETILIGQSENKLTHAAVYLGEGLYISKFGASGSLMVTSLKAMKRGFGGDLTWTIRPKQGTPTHGNVSTLNQIVQ